MFLACLGGLASERESKDPENLSLTMPIQGILCMLCPSDPSGASRKSGIIMRFDYVSNGFTLNRLWLTSPIIFAMSVEIFDGREFPNRSRVGRDQKCHYISNGKIAY